MTALLPHNRFIDPSDVRRRTEDYPPIRARCDRTEVLEIALQSTQSKDQNIHVLDILSHVIARIRYSKLAFYWRSLATLLMSACSTVPSFMLLK
ncbi:MAG: hypothetical protein ACRD59_17050, partial [Candidatus Acidiferrales bacterium]